MLVMDAMPLDSDVAAVFPGAVRDDSRTRVLDLDGAALEEPDAQMERARLATRGFVVAYARCWTWNDGTAYVTVYELGSREQAALAVADLRETLRAAGAAMSSLARIDGDCTEFICALMSEGGGAHSAIATVAVDRLHVLSIVADTATGPAPSPADAGTLAAIAIDRVIGARRRSPQVG
jgi:hypothetical protein